MFKGEDGHANTYPMHGRRDAAVGAAKLIIELEKLAFETGGWTTTTRLTSRPWGACNIQSETCVTFCVMHEQEDGLLNMADEALKIVKKVGAQGGLETSAERTLHLLPGKFWPEAIDCIKAACDGRGMGSITRTAHDSTMTQLLVPTGMVFARAKDGVSHNPKEWTSKEDCAESALVLGRSILNFDEYLKQKET